jgi:hypothetical protein
VINMPTFRALERFVAARRGSCQIIAAGEIFCADPEDLPAIRSVIEPVDQEAMAALNNAPLAKETGGWFYPGKGGTGMNGRSGAFMWSGERG